MQVLPIKSHIRRPSNYPNNQAELKINLSGNTNQNIVHVIENWAANNNVTTPGTGNLFNIQQGYNAYERVGRNISILQCHIRGWIERPKKGPTSTVLQPQMFRIIIFNDFHPSGTNVNLGFVMNGLSSGSALMTFQSAAAISRGRILYDFVIYSSNLTIFNLTNTPTYTGDLFPFDFVLDFSQNPLLVTYSGDTGGLASILSNSLQIWCGCLNDVSTTSDPTPKINYLCETTYIDK